MDRLAPARSARRGRPWAPCWLLAIRGYGQLLLTQPWNPYLPLLSWIVVLLAVWAVLCGDALMLVPVVVAGSLCAQTHVPYLVPAGLLVLAALGHVAWWGRHDRRQRRLVAARRCSASCCGCRRSSTS